jgi:Cu+-exporting ATPase
MTCRNCARSVTEAIQSVPGIASASVTLDEGRARVRWSPAVAPDAARIIEAVRAAGYDARPLGAAGDGGGKPGGVLAGWRFNVVVGSVVTAVLMVGEWALGLGMERWFQWAAFALALPVQVLCGARFYRGAWSQLKARSSNMDTLVALGSTAAFGYSAWGLFAHGAGHLYFMEAAAIITLISIGHWLEALVSARAAGALRALLKLAPETARRLDADGQERTVPVGQLEPGDRAVLRPGDRVPTDGEVLEGSSAVDESMLTGESLPVDKAPGAKVYGGTANQNGRLVVKVTATGNATALAQIIAVVERAQNSRAAIQKLGDRVSSVFVPVVILIALATALGWGLAPETARRAHGALVPFLWAGVLPQTALAAAVIQAAAVLIVACPCAMGLATPAAIMAGTNVAARRGILIRDGTALEKSGRITAVLFDKTGTLTQGKVAVAAVTDLRYESARTLSIQHLAASLARPSNHPLSVAVAGTVPRADAARSLTVTAWQERRGAGLQAQWAEHGSALAKTTLRLGSLNWLRAEGVNLTAGTTFVNKWSAQGATLLGLAADHRLLGLFALRDELKPDAAGVVARLARHGKHVYLITGDSRATASAIGRQAGVPPQNVFAEVRPEQKAGIVQQLQQRGERVAFVGDGINDAPALEQADLGVAVARASDVAREAADIILLKSDIHAIPEALGLAQATLRTIKQNLFWAFFYNAAAVPLAALGFLSPVLCAAAMGLSDLIVLGNALRLRRWKG